MPGVFVSPKGSTDIHRVSGGQLELSSGFDLAVGTRHDLALPAGMQLSDFRWVVFSAGDDADSFDDSQRVPTGSIRQVPSGGVLYAAGIIGGQIQFYIVDQSDGTLTSVGNLLGSGFLNGAGLATISGWVYAAIQTGVGTVSIYVVNPNFTALTHLLDVTGVGASVTTGVALTHNSNDLILAVEDRGGDDISVFHIDVSAQTSSLLMSTLRLATLSVAGATNLNGDVFAVVIFNAGNNVYKYQLFGVNVTSGALTAIGPEHDAPITGPNSAGMSFDTAGNLRTIFTGQNTARYGSINPSTGEFSQLGSLSISPSIGHGVGMVFRDAGGPPYTRVSNQFALQRDGQTGLQFLPILAGRVHSVVGVL